MQVLLDTWLSKHRGSGRQSQEAGQGHAKSSKDHSCKANCVTVYSAPWLWVSHTFHTEMVQAYWLNLSHGSLVLKVLCLHLSWKVIAYIRGTGCILAVNWSENLTIKIPLESEAEKLRTRDQKCTLSNMVANKPHVTIEHWNCGQSERRYAVSVKYTVEFEDLEKTKVRV